MCTSSLFFTYIPSTEIFLNNIDIIPFFFLFVCSDEKDNSDNTATGKWNHKNL